MTSGRVSLSRGTVFQDIQSGVGFETGDFVKEKGVGGATVEPLLCLSFRVQCR